MLVPLTQGKFAIIDDEDYEKVKGLCWQYSNKRYARNCSSRNPNKSVLMHRLILGLSRNNEIFVDHINGNGLDNQKCNLRLCSLSQNNFHSKKYSNNKSGYKGVHWYKHNKKWGVHIRKSGKLYYLGLFDVIEDAARVYDDAARKLFGEFALTNSDIQNEI